MRSDGQMDHKLQQAIVATRTGEYETAQLLLVDALEENPQEAEAWFLLAHLVDSPERQARFLEFVLTLQRDHALARKHLDRLVHPEVPSPVIKQPSRTPPAEEPATPAPQIDSDFSPIPPARTEPVSNASASDHATSSPRVTPQYDSKRMDPNWSRTAGTPRREGEPARPSVRQTSAPVVRAVPPANVAATPAPAPEKPKPVNKWLFAVLIVLVGVLFAFLSFLAYTLIFQ